MSTPPQEVIISTREVEQCAVLDVTARNFTYPQTNVLKTIVAKLINDGQRRFVLNVAHVELVDSYGLATIVSTLRLIREAHGGLALCNLNDMFAHLVEVTHLERVLEIWPSEQQAIYYVTTSVKAPSR